MDPTLGDSLDQEATSDDSTAPSGPRGATNIVLSKVASVMADLDENESPRVNLRR